MTLRVLKFVKPYCRNVVAAAEYARKLANYLCVCELFTTFVVENSPIWI